MFGEVGLFDKVGDATVEIDKDFVGWFRQFVFAVIDVVVSEHLQDAHVTRLRRMILPAVPHRIAQLRFDIAHWKAAVCVAQHKFKKK